MGLIKCPECKKKISDQCECCPNCGYPFKQKHDVIEIAKADSANELFPKEDKPFFKRVWFWCMIAIVMVIAIILGIIWLNGGAKQKNDESKPVITETQPKVDESGKPIFVELTDEVYTKANDYLGYYVNVKGKVFQNLGDNGEVKGVQVWIDPENSEQNVMVYYTNEVTFKDGDYVVCSGYIKEICTYKNAFGTELSVPLIQSTDARSATYIEVMSPTISSIDLENLTYEKYGYSISFEKVEFAEDETRLYLTTINNGKTTMYVDTGTSVIIQDGNQFNPAVNYEANYEEIPYNLSVGTTVTGVVSFPRILEDDFEYVIEMHSDNSDERFEKVTFKISKDISSVFIPVVKPNAVWDFDELKYETKGYTIAIDKIEFYDNETRIYLAATNEGKAELYVDTEGSIVVQNKKQFNTEVIYDADYDELPYKIAKGACATGAISFQTIDVSEFEYTIEIYSDDYEEEFVDVVFIINENSPYCKTAIEEDEKENETEAEKPEPPSYPSAVGTYSYISDSGWEHRLYIYQDGTLYMDYYLWDENSPNADSPDCPLEGTWTQSENILTYSVWNTDGFMWNNPFYDTVYWDGIDFLGECRQWYHRSFCRG